jgi:hypothetical protein
MLITRKDEITSREEAIEILLSLKTRRKDIKLKRFKLEKDTWVYIEDNENTKRKYDSFVNRLKKSRSSEKFKFFEV